MRITEEHNANIEKAETSGTAKAKLTVEEVNAVSGGVSMGPDIAAVISTAVSAGVLITVTDTNHA